MSMLQLIERIENVAEDDEGPKKAYLGPLEFEVRDVVVLGTTKPRIVYFIVDGNHIALIPGEKKADRRADYGRTTKNKTMLFWDENAKKYVLQGGSGNQIGIFKPSEVKISKTN